MLRPGQTNLTLTSPIKPGRNQAPLKGCFETLVESKRGSMPLVKYWEIIADNLSASGWSWGCVSAVDSGGRTIFIADARRDNGKRFVVRAEEKLTAFMELESAIGAAKFPQYLCV